MRFFTKMDKFYHKKLTIKNSRDFLKSLSYIIHLFWNSTILFKHRYPMIEDWRNFLKASSSSRWKTLELSRRCKINS